MVIRSNVANYEHGYLNRIHHMTETRIMGMTSYLTLKREIPFTPCYYLRQRLWIPLGGVDARYGLAHV